ncbi:TPA: MFS transporter [Acinetobacter baumannii]|nr:MFS transporter [Acinetobacter baumannii]HCQ9871800.1 MFS transporter [Acinetobacter baumannii]HEB4101792.1 MFS transporter [Acinetobacter baumannii]HEB4105845.1 MFS transporter [Acinetobacter baumannii]HEG4460284.1 MFS transporter [Acinetobacter baumannii]
MGATSEVSKIYRKIDLRILPFLLVCYFISYLDRVNIGFAKLHMQSDLGLSDAAYGLGAGIFFIGYAIFETPSNLLLTKIGARKTLSRVMLLWGITSSCMFLVNNEINFYILRFFLGVFEAGFAPGMIYYLTLWYGRDRLARVMAITMLAGPIGSIIGAPLSTWIMTEFAGIGGLKGWQWMFLIEGFPAVILGILALKLLVDAPSQAKWLSDDEKKIHAKLVISSDNAHSSFRAALKDPRIYLMAFGYFCLICGIYSMSFWLPSLIRDSGVNDLMSIGFLSAIPYIAAIIFMQIFGRTSDIYNERRWHTSIPAFIAAISLAISTVFTDNLLISLIFLSLGTAFIWSAYTVFWAIPAQYLQGTAAAGGIAVINTIGLLGGFVSPTLIGLLKSYTGSSSAGVLAMALIVGFGSILLAANKPRTKVSLTNSPLIK